MSNKPNPIKTQARNARLSQTPPDLDIFRHVRAGNVAIVTTMVRVRPSLIHTRDLWGRQPIDYARLANNKKLIDLLLPPHKNAVAPPVPPSAQKKPALPTIKIEQTASDFIEGEQEEEAATRAPADATDSSEGPLDVLTAMFPDTPQETLALALIECEGNVQSATDLLLAQLLTETPSEGQPQNLALNSEAEFPSLAATSPAPATAAYQPPLLSNLRQLEQQDDNDEEEVEWVDYEEDADFEDVAASSSDGDHQHTASAVPHHKPHDNDDVESFTLTGTEETSSVVLIEGDNWDVVSQTSEMSFLEVSDRPMTTTTTTTTTTLSSPVPAKVSFSAALKQNMTEQQREGVKVRAPRLPPAFSESPRPGKGACLHHEIDDQVGDFADPKDLERTFGRQSKPRHGNQPTYRKPKAKGKTTKGF